MELVKIEQLIEKYFKATTTVIEEETLRAYFSKENVAPHLKQYTPMFQYFSEAKKERYTKHVPLKTKNNFYKWSSIAVVIVLVFSIYFGYEYKQRRDAQYAYEQTKKALNLLAENFEKGTQKVSYLEKFEETKQKIYNKN